MSGLRKRQNVFELGGDWADPILWYARGVKAMKARKLDDPTSWNFYAAIHGILREIWDLYLATNAADANPGSDDTATYLDQCQHQSWFFLPWHRGYLLALENMIRHEIELLNGPHETWALPYWNYFATGQNVLPPAFLAEDLPDSLGENPLHVKDRYGPIVANAPFDIASVANLDAMSESDFFGPGGGVSAGFGGPVTGFNWNSGTNGGLEANPHGQIHVLVGGRHPTLTFNGRPVSGLMGSPVTAALDPIFYLHHCNIDRLWESWNKFPAGKPSQKPTDWQNPKIPLWLEGPPNVGQQAFAMPNPDKSKWVYTPAQMQDIAALGYEYDSLEPGAVVPPDPLAGRLVTLGISAKPAAEAGAVTMAQSKAEMIGASESGISLAGSAAMRTFVRTVPGARAKVAESLSGAARSLPDRVFLNLENVTGSSDAEIVLVYVGLPEGADPASNKDYLAGSISMFGVSQASDPDGTHAGNGITFTLEISRIVDKLHLAGDFDVDDLSVELVPLQDIPEAADIRIGRISLYRQFQ